MQCGYCTPGMILTAHALLTRNDTPSHDDIVEAISGNICRCTGYGQIVEAVEFAADRLRKTNAPRDPQRAPAVEKTGADRKRALQGAHPNGPHGGRS